MEREGENVRVGAAEFGFGVFALERIRPGETIGYVEGTVIDDPEHGSDYCMELTTTQGLEPYAPFRFVNHSCQPNCALLHVEVIYDDRSPPETEICIEALEEIEPGEQLTIDYAWPAGEAIPCGCGSANCRGWIVAEEEANLLVPAEQFV